MVPDSFKITRSTLNAAALADARQPGVRDLLAATEFEGLEAVATLADARQPGIRDLSAAVEVDGLKAGAALTDARQPGIRDPIAAPEVERLEVGQPSPILANPVSVIFLQCSRLTDRTVLNRCSVASSPASVNGLALVGQYGPLYADSGLAQPKSSWTGAISSEQACRHALHNCTWPPNGVHPSTQHRR